MPSPDTEAPLRYATGERPRVAILPIEVEGNDPAQRHLARGLTADLIGDLSLLRGLTLISGSSVDSGDAGAIPPLAAASFRLLGQVHRATDQIRLHLVLIETASGQQIWGRRYERPFAQLPHIHDQAVMDLAQVLSIDITADEYRRLQRRHTHDAEAYDRFLEAQARLMVREPSENRRARQLYREAIDLDPTFARAWGGLALTHAADYRNQWTDDVGASLAQARQAAQTAARLDPDLPEVLWMLADVEVQERNHQLALQYLDRALELNPSFAEAYALKGGVMTHMGAPADAVLLLQHAMRLNPSASYLAYLLLGRAYFFLGETAQALSNLRLSAARNPTYLETHIYLAAAAASAGDSDLAEWEALEVLNLRPGFSLGAWLTTYPMTDDDQKARLMSALQGLGLTGGRHPPIQRD